MSEVSGDRNDRIKEVNNKVLESPTRHIIQIPSNDSADSESESKRPPNKMPKYEKLEALIIQHVSSLTNFVHSQVGAAQTMPSAALNDSVMRLLPSTAEGLGSDNSTAEFLTRPVTYKNMVLNLGEVGTTIDNSSAVRSARECHINAINKIQRFGSDSWKDVKYHKALQTLVARPGFVELDVNPELLNYNKKKDYLAGTERTMAGLTYGLLEHKDILKNSLQSIVDWAASSPSELNANNLFEKIESLFGPKSQSFNNLEQLMQVVSGKRAECIQVRRDKIIVQVSDQALRSALKKTPPSITSLFDSGALASAMQDQGDTHTWLNTSTSLNENTKLQPITPWAKTFEIIPSTSSYKPFTQTKWYNQTHKNHKGIKKFYKGKPKKGHSFRNTE